MDKGKARGDFATAYKLSRTGDDSSKRVKRRSMEWKEIRRDQADKRRNINSNDLSPVMEGDMSQQSQNKSYKGQTPVKAPRDPQPSASNDSTKVNNRLEMLKKWKAEKDQRKKEDERNRKAPAFKVSGKIERKDASSLYNKPTTVKGPSKTTIPAPKPHTATTAKTAGGKPSTKTQATTDRHLAKSPLPHGNLRGPQKSTMLKKAHSPKAAALKKSRSPKTLKRPHSPKAAAASVGGTRTRQTRSSASQQVPTKPQPTTTTRQLRGQAHPKAATVAKTGPVKRKAETVTKSKLPEVEMVSETETSVVKTPPRVSLSKVTTRGNSDTLASFAPDDTTFSAPATLASFAPDDTTFSAPANVHSFVFKPLSPASAATFLFPNQDPSACASFLETKPNRASTPKSGDKEKAVKIDETVVSNAVVESNKTERKPDDAKMEVENIESETEQTTKSSPAKRRSSRRSVSHAGDVSDNETVLKDVPSPKSASVTPARSTRRSVGQAADMSSYNEPGPKPPVVTPARSARKSRRSVLPTVSETDTTSSESDIAESEKNIIQTPQQSAKRSTRRSLRRSVISISETEPMALGEEESCSPAKRSRRSRRSVSSAQNPNADDNEQSSDSGVETYSMSLHKNSRKSNISQATEEDGVTKENANIKDQYNKETPGRSRRSTRRSNVSQVNEDNVFSKENEQVDGENQSDTNVNSVAGASEIDATEEVKSEKRVTRARFRDTVSDSTTPARQKGKAGRKSFGGFAMPSSNSCVLSAKRRARKSMMPKSPEEWVKLLNNSPMVEMSRRTPKAANKSASMIVPPLNFDDIDLENLPPAYGAEAAATTPALREDTATQTSNLTQPMGNLGLGEASLMASPMSTVSSSPRGMSVPSPQAASPLPGTPVSSQSQSACQAAASQEQASELMIVTPGTSQSNRALARSPRQGGSSNTTENLQVEEITSTCTEDYLSDELLGIKHFRDLLDSERSRLRGLCSRWDEYNDSASDISDDIRGQIRTVIGQAVLLMNERFKQFKGLVDNCEFKRGEKETTVTDLQGFWDMIYFQVEDVIIKFDSLDKLRNNNWVEDKPKLVAKKVVKKKVTKPVAAKPAGKSKFAAFRAQMKKQKTDESSGSPRKEEEKVFEVPGFFQVASPVRSPRPHCEGGTPKKSSRQVTPVNADSSAKDSLAVPPEQPGSEELLKRTPARKSYAPVIPSPLLKDTTPLPRPQRSCTKKTPVPKRLLAQTESMVVDEAHPSMQNSEKTELEKTPKRRSLRPRKSVTFDEHVKSTALDSPAAMTANSPATECNDAEFARLLQPISVLQENETTDEANDSFSKYLKPSRNLNTSVEKENTPKQSGRRRRSSLKTTKSSEKRRSRGHVQFVSPVNEQEHLSMPHTPYNRDSLVKQKRVTRHSDLSSSENSLDVFDIENIDEEDTLTSLPSPFSRSAKEARAPKQTGRPSLLYTPPKTKSRTPTNKNVPTATLVSFSP